MTDSADVMLVDSVFQLSNVLGYGDAGALLDSGLVRDGWHVFGSDEFFLMSVVSDKRRENYNRRGHRDILGDPVALIPYMDYAHWRFMLECCYHEDFRLRDDADYVLPSFLQRRRWTVGPFDYVTVLRLLAGMIRDDSHSDAVVHAAALAALITRFTGSRLPPRVAWIDFVDEHPELSVIREPSRQPLVEVMDSIRCITITM